MRKPVVTAAIFERLEQTRSKLPVTGDLFLVSGFADRGGQDLPPEATVPAQDRALELQIWTHASVAAPSTRLGKREITQTQPARSKGAKMKLKATLISAAALAALALPALAETAYPAIGHTYKSDYGDRAFRTAFDADGKTLRTAPFDSEDFEATATVATYQVVNIRPGVFMVTWQEADGITVTHVEDFENDTVYSALTLPDNQFFTFTGSWTPVD